MRTALLLGVVLASVASPALAQDRRCTLRIRNVDREGIQVTPLDGVVNYFAGGNVFIDCVGQNVQMRADSVALYQGVIAQFIGNVRYRDSSVTMTADFGTYFRDGDRWEARGNVRFVNRDDGSNLTGPALDYYRAIPVTRPVAEMYADQRPTIRTSSADATASEEPYVIVGDRVRMRGKDQLWAGGRVTIDRSDFRGRSDSLDLDTGTGNRGVLFGRASLRRVASDSFSLDADRIDLTLAAREVTGVYAQTRSHLLAEGLDLRADSIRLALRDRKVERTEAWGDAGRAEAVSDDYRITADSLAIDTPGQRLREVRGFGTAWAGLPADSLEESGDWIAGDTLVLVFSASSGDTAGTGQRATLERLHATLGARSFFRVRDPIGGRSINYTRADTIIVTMKGTGDSATVDLVRAVGNVDGVQLQPGTVPRRVPADSTRPDATVAAPGGGRP